MLTNINFSPIKNVWSDFSEIPGARLRTVFRTANGKLMTMPNFSPWHIDKYNIVEYIILPE